MTCLNCLVLKRALDYAYSNQATRDVLRYSFERFFVNRSLRSVNPKIGGDTVIGYATDVPDEGNFDLFTVTWGLGRSVRCGRNPTEPRPPKSA